MNKTDLKKLSSQELTELKYAVGLSNLKRDIKETLFTLLDKQQARTEALLQSQINGQENKYLEMVMSGIFIK